MDAGEATSHPPHDDGGDGEAAVANAEVLPFRVKALDLHPDPGHGVDQGTVPNECISTNTLAN